MVVTPKIGGDMASTWIAKPDVHVEYVTHS